MKAIKILAFIAVCCSVVYLSTRPPEKGPGSAPAFAPAETAASFDPNPMKVNPRNADSLPERVLAVNRP